MVENSVLEFQKSLVKALAKCHIFLTLDLFDLFDHLIKVICLEASCVCIFIVLKDIFDL